MHRPFPPTGALNPARRMHHAPTVAALLVLISLAGCASTPTSGSSGAAGVLAFPTEPIAPGTHRLSVRGMSCPKCVSNVDMQLKRLPGVTNALVDMRNGTVTIDVSGDRRPTARQLANAVEDAGFTLASIDAAEGGR